MYRSLFTMAALCGLTLSFVLMWILAPPVAEQSEPTDVGLSDTEAFRVASELVERRNAALIAGDGEALAVLTEADSPARADDEALLASLPPLAQVETLIMDVHVLSRTLWEVQSVQYEVVTASGEEFGPQDERCTRWHMAENPWRLVRTGECGEVG